MRNDIWVTAGHRCGHHVPPPSLLPVLPLTWSMLKPSLAWHSLCEFSCSFHWYQPVLSCSFLCCMGALAALQTSWSGLQLLCLFPHYQLSHPDRNSSFHENTEALVPFCTSPPVRHSGRSVLQAASAVRSCSWGPLRVGFGCLRTDLRDQQVSCRLGSRRGFLVGPVERRSKSPHVGCFWGF